MTAPHGAAPRVVKIGGRPQSDAALPAAIAAAWRSGTPLVVVHGGGDEVSQLQRALGVEARFVGGRRVTSEADIEIVRMALSGSANKRLVAALVGEGVPALGLSGEDAGLLAATLVDPAQLGRVGAPQRIHVQLLWHLLDGGFLPVLSPVSRNAGTELGPALNVNGDDAAAAIAVALGAPELLLVADVPGVLADGRPVTQLDPRGAQRLLDDGTAAGGMRAKLQSALAAVAGGVERVRIGDIAAITDPSRGTVIAQAAAYV